MSLPPEGRGGDDLRGPDAAGSGGPPDAPDPLGWRLVRSLIAPDVLRDAGNDAPLSRRGRRLFGLVVGVLVVAIVVLVVLTLTR